MSLHTPNHSSKTCGIPEVSSSTTILRNVVDKLALVDRKRAKDLMLGLNETINQLAMANNVRWYGYVLRKEDGHVMIMTLDIKAEGQRNKRRPK